LAQGFTGIRAVNARVVELAFEAYDDRAPLRWSGNIVFGEDGDDIPSL